MREIKFRVWDKFNKIMIKPENFIDEYITSEGKVVEKEIDTAYGYSDMYLIDISENRELMQYIGLTDIDGNDIYEGDIIEFQNHHGVVKYLPEHGSFLIREEFGYTRIDAGNAPQTNYKVLGNIYEHSYLLEE